MTNSVGDILHELKGKSSTFGWGAVAVFNRSTLNHMLEDQFAKRLGDARLLSPVSIEFDPTNLGHMRMELDSIQFGPPQLSFQSSAISSSMATLRFEIVAGDYATTNTHVETPDRLLSSGRLAEGMGFTLEMEIDLNPIVGEISGSGVVSIDFHNAENPRCNLVPESPTQRRIGALLLAEIQKQPAFRQSWQLGLLDLSTSGPLSPTHFAIRTQAMPNSNSVGSTQDEEGAVIFFIALKGLRGTATSFPSTFPHLIPDDERNGKQLYSATLLLDEQLINLATESELDALKSLVLPRDHAFDEGERHTPYDLIIFGNAKPNNEYVKIQPPLASIKNATTKQFTAHRGDGSELSGITWDARCITMPTASGSISATGRYQAVDKTVFGTNVLPTVISAHYDNGTKSKSALIFARFEKITVAPIVATSEMDGTPIIFAASSVGGGALNWRLISPSYGTLVPVGKNQAMYVPPANIGQESIVNQRIEVRDVSTGDTVEASVILVGTETHLKVNPPHITSVLGRGAVPLSVGSFGQKVTWHLLGDGEIDKDAGVFSPPLTLSTSAVSVAVCEVDFGAGAVLRGFSVIELADRQQEIKGWEGLQEFSITAMGPARSYVNGMQQIPIEIKIETTAPAPGSAQPHMPISDLELSSLRLVEKTGNTLVPVLAEHEEGIEWGATTQWAVHDRPNRFRLTGGFTATDSSTPQNAGTRYRRYYIHLAHRGDAVEFYAQFHDKYGSVWNSLEHGPQDKSTIQVSGISIPTRSKSNYKLARNRVWHNLATGRVEFDDFGNEDDFSSIQESIDHWSVNYVSDDFKSIGFSTLRILDNSSTIQWESDLDDETYCSYTGYAFSPISHPPKPQPPVNLHFDGYLRALARAVSHPQPSDEIIAHPPAPGELVVSVHRTHEFSHWRDSMAAGNDQRKFRERLESPVTYMLRDEDGNLHSVDIGFLVKSAEDSRNSLQIDLIAARKNYYGLGSFERI
ncbi:hypothetical protein GA830_01705 [Mesorhizobium sp. NBSH29]|uniref:hypothetical protein n=1 Tax=Mesorhizobium sp. NBSH29 TaxID=2654249 RepID=UPI0018968981|nr:hypothetical protein [Mesorhizobium sp. NBSH29]QPC85596.1 hypothetical protein GA830_01705 [Mesorhizobium sp. NBSH29]